MRPGQTILGQARPNQTRPGQARPDKTKPDKSRTRTGHSSHTSSCIYFEPFARDRPDQTRPGHAIPGQTRPDQTRPDQNKPDQTRQGQIRPGQARPDRVRSYLADCSIDQWQCLGHARPCQAKPKIGKVAAIAQPIWIIVCCLFVVRMLNFYLLPSILSQLVAKPS